MLVGRLNRLPAAIVVLILGVLFGAATAGPAASKVQPISADTGDVLDLTYDAPGDVAPALAGEPGGLERSVAQRASTATPVGGTSGHVYDAVRAPVAPRTAALVCSFSGETEVVMADGTSKPISEVEVGDEVLAVDPETGQRGARRVLNLFVHDDALVDLSIGGEVVSTTGDHPFWNHSDGAFQRADALDSGDLVLTADGDLVSVDGLVAGSEAWGTAYNLHIEEIHTYFVVVGDEEALVHNTCLSASNYRRLFREQNPGMPSNYQVHHALPQKYESVMRDAGINIHENQFLRGVPRDVHQEVTNAWRQWERSLGHSPTATDISNFSYSIDEQFGQYFIFGSP